MAGVNIRASAASGRRFGEAAITAPCVVMSWEDWLTFGAALVTFLSVAISIQQAHWVSGMPPLVVTAVGGLLIGMVAARTRTKAIAIHPVALVLGAIVVLLVVQNFADGANILQRLGDFRTRMREWIDVIRAGDISNDNLPFVTLVHSVCFICAYLASWSLFRWRNAWLAVIPSGMVLLANIAFLDGQPSATFIVFLFGAVILLARVHMQRSQSRWRKQGVDYPEFISLNAMQLTIVASLVIIAVAWSLPIGGQTSAAQGLFNWMVSPVTSQTDTFVRLFHNVDGRKGAKLHSLGDILAIQSHVQLGSGPVFDVTSAAPGLVRAQSYEVYTGNGWKTSGRQDTKVPAQQIAVTPAGTAYSARTTETLTIKLLDSENTLLTAGTAVGANVATTIETPRGAPGDIERMQSQAFLHAGDTYNSVGSVSVATADQLLQAGTNYPSWITQQYLQLPNSLPQEVRQEAARVAASSGGSTPYQEAVAIEQYLRTFPFDLNVTAPPPGRDMVDYFLFTLKRGYFDYQASTMAVMLRSLGIPARVTVGYVLDPLQAKGSVYTVTRDDTYSWVEVFFPQYGWVNFNPTSDRLVGGIGGLGGAAFGGSLETPDPAALAGLLGTNAALGPDKSPAVAQALKQPATIHGTPPWLLIWTLTGGVVALLAAALAARISWTWGMRGLSGRARMWAHAQRVAGWAGIGGKPSETPHEWSHRVGGVLQGGDDAATLAAAYEESRYGPPGTRRVEEGDVAGAYLRLRAKLFGEVLRRGRREKETPDVWWSAWNKKK